jgi:hypothetical protein
MARWTAQCWLGSANGYQQLEVQSNTPHGAKEQLKRIYGAEQIVNLRQVNGSSSSSGGSDTAFNSTVVLGGIVLAVVFWPIAIVLGILYALYKIFV